MKHKMVSCPWVFVRNRRELSRSLCSHTKGLEVMFVYVLEPHGLDIVAKPYHKVNR